MPPRVMTVSMLGRPLALWSDTDSIRKKGADHRELGHQFPNKSLPYFSTIVFGVRKGNLKGIKDWPESR